MGVIELGVIGLRVITVGLLNMERIRICCPILLLLFHMWTQSESNRFSFFLPCQVSLLEKLFLCHTFPNICSGHALIGPHSSWSSNVCSSWPSPVADFTHLLQYLLWYIFRHKQSWQHLCKGKQTSAVPVLVIIRHILSIRDHFIWTTVELQRMASLCFFFFSSLHCVFCSLITD